MIDCLNALNERGSFTHANSNFSRQIIYNYCKIALIYHVTQGFNVITNEIKDR
jgi:hypothetical protein